LHAAGLLSRPLASGRRSRRAPTDSPGGRCLGARGGCRKKFPASAARRHVAPPSDKHDVIVRLAGHLWSIIGLPGDVREPHRLRWVSPGSSPGSTHPTGPRLGPRVAANPPPPAILILAGRRCLDRHGRSWWQRKQAKTQMHADDADTRGYTSAA